jgi:hypothetical protein
MTRHRLHIPGEPYAVAASRHQAEVDIRAAIDRHDETQLERLLKMRVSELIGELGPKDREHLCEMLEIHATGWRI